MAHDEKRTTLVDSDHKFLALIKAAQSAKNRFSDTHRTILEMGYDAKQKGYWNRAGSSWANGIADEFRRRVSKTTQAVEVFGTRLYGDFPKRRVSPNDWVRDVAQQRADLMEQYLNHTAIECDVRSEDNRAVQDAILAGRGVLWTGLDPKSGMVTSVWRKVDDVFVDPDEHQHRYCKWVYCNRYILRRRLMKFLMEQGASKDALAHVSNMKACARPSDRGEEHSDSADKGSELVCYLEWYFKSGLNDYGIKNSKGDFVGGARKVWTTQDGKYLLDSEWEIPLWMDNEFPCTFVDLHDHPESVWPMSVLEPGITWNEMMNQILTRGMARVDFAQRLLVAIKNNGVTDDSVDELLYETEAGVAFMELTANFVNEEQKIDDVIQQMELDLGVDGLVAAYMFCSSEYDKHTGLYEFLATGNAEHQMRSAEEAKIRDTNTTSRLSDYQTRIKRWRTKVARKEAMAARFLHDPEDIGKIFGQEAGILWGYLMSPESETQSLQMGFEPQGTSMESFMREVSYSVEDGEGERRSHEQRVQASTEMMNQTYPTLMQLAKETYAADPYSDKAQIIAQSATVIAVNHAKHALQAEPDEIEAIRVLPLAFTPIPPPPPMPVDPMTGQPMPPGPPTPAGMPPGGPPA